jgi:hypothetical protein
MVECPPLPTRVNSASSGALDPTQVIPRPQPLDQMAVDGARIISGEVLPGHECRAGTARHRAARTRRSGRGAVGTAVLSATGVVAGLSLLMSHESADSSQGSPREPVGAAPAKAAAIDPPLGAAPVSAPLKATGEQPQAAEATVPQTADDSAARRPSSARTVPGKHARSSGSWATSDWQEAVQRAEATRRAGQQDQGGGRHRADGASKNTGYGGRYGGGGAHGYGHGYGGGPGQGS